jgi:heat shock protein HtpX
MAAVGLAILAVYGAAELLDGLDAVPLARERAPRLHRALDALSERMGLGRPRLLVANLGAPNSLALGGVRDGAVVLDWRLFHLLDAGERTALLAHELAHIESRDALVQTFAYAVARTAAGTVLLVLSPALLLATGVHRALAWLRGRPPTGPEAAFGPVNRWVAHLVSLGFVGLTLAVRAHSRRREFAADDRAATVTGDPVAMARALRRIQRATDPPGGLLAPLYVHGEEDAWSALFSTHPPTDERIERLLARADGETRASGRRIPVE